MYRVRDIFDEKNKKYKITGRSRIYIYILHIHISLKMCWTQPEAFPSCLSLANIIENWNSRWYFCGEMIHITLTLYFFTLYINTQVPTLSQHIHNSSRAQDLLTCQVKKNKKGEIEFFISRPFQKKTNPKIFFFPYLISKLSSNHSKSNLSFFYSCTYISLM